MSLTPVLRIDVASIRDFQSEVAAKGRPVILTGRGDRSARVAAWTLADLVARFGHIKVPVRDLDDEFKEFFEVKDDPVGMKPRRMVPLSDYVRVISSHVPGASRPPYAGNISMRNDPAVAKRFATMLAECKFPAWLPSNARDEYNLWVGAPGQRSTIHNDPYHNFNAQIIGSKRFVLFAPDQHGALYPEFFHAGMWASRIDPDAPDLASFPRFADAKGFECELQEGEILFLPRFWWHAVQARKLSVNVNRWVFSDDERWHQQPEARPFISYDKLIELVKQQFASLPAFAREFERGEYERISAELTDLMESKIAGTVAARTEPSWN